MVVGGGGGVQQQQQQQQQQRGPLIRSMSEDDELPGAGAHTRDDTDEEEDNGNNNNNDNDNDNVNDDDSPMSPVLDTSAMAQNRNNGGGGGGSGNGNNSYATGNFAPAAGSPGSGRPGGDAFVQNILARGPSLEKQLSMGFLDSMDSADIGEMVREMQLHGNERDEIAQRVNALTGRDRTAPPP